MNPEPPDSSHDPLKQAIARQYGGMRAPDALRKRCLAILEEPAPIRLWPRRLVIAASILIFLAGGAWYGWHKYQEHEEHEYLEANERQLQLMTELAKAPFENDPAAFKDWPIHASATADQSLTFVAARKAVFQAGHAMQIRYKLGNEQFDVFTVPGSLLGYSEEGWKYTTDISGMTLVGWIKSGQLHCIVSSSASLPRRVTLH